MSDEKTIFENQEEKKKDNSQDPTTPKEQKEEMEKGKINIDEPRAKNKPLFYKKWWFFTILGVLAVIAIVVMVYYFLFAQSFFTVLVKDQKTNKTLSDVSVQIKEEKKQTDLFGKARFDNLKPGAHTVIVTLEGYAEVEEPVTLKRGNNGDFTVYLDLILINVSGTLYDYVDKAPLEKVSVTLRDQTQETDSEGKFDFQEILPGTQKIKFNKESYQERTIEVSGVLDTQLGDFYLIPSPKVIFVSNRDGNKAVYQSFFNGEGVEKLWENKKGFDDYQAVLSPDTQYLTFYSTRDGVEDNYGGYKSYLYFNARSGTELTKVSDQQGIVVWLDDSSGFLYNYSEYQNNETSSIIKRYDLDNKELRELLNDTDFETKQVTSSARIDGLKTAPNNKMVFMVENWLEAIKTGIYKADTDGESLSKLTDKNPYSFALTPDRNKIQFTYYQNQTNKRYEIDLATGTEKEILFDHSGKSLGQGYFDYEEKFSADGNLKAYIDYRDGKNDLYLTDKDGNKERRLSAIGGVSDFEFIDNKYLVFYVNKPDEESALYVIGLLDGNEPLKITDVVEFTGVVE